MNQEFNVETYDSSMNVTSSIKAWIMVKIYLKSGLMEGERKC